MTCARCRWAMEGVLYYFCKLRRRWIVKDIDSGFGCEEYVEGHR